MPKVSQKMGMKAWNSQAKILVNASKLYPFAGPKRGIPSAKMTLKTRELWLQIADIAGCDIA